MTKKNYISLLLSVLALLFFYIVPTPDGLTWSGKMMLGILVFGAILFVSEAIPLGMAGLAVMILPIVLGITRSTTAFSLFGNSAVFFLIGAFILAAGFHKSGLHRRLAHRVVGRKGKSPRMFILSVIAISMGLSLVMSEHGVVALLVPIVVYSLMQTPPGTNIRKGGTIALAYGCSIGSVGTLLGCGRNPYTVAFLYQAAGVMLSFTQWALMALPVVLLMLPLTWFWITRVFPPEDDIKLVVEKQDTPVSSSEIKVAVILIGTVLSLILVPSMDVAVVILIGAIALFVSGVLEWKDVERTIPWGVVLLYGGAITLAEGLSITGASLWIATIVVDIIGNNPYFILFILIVVTMLVTEVMSNTAAVAIMLPIGAGLAYVITGLNILVTSVAIALAGGFAFMFIIGTPGNLITYTTGFYRTRDLMKVGLLMNITGVVVIFAVANTLWRLMGVW